MCATNMGILSYRLRLGLGHRGFDGLYQFGERNEMAFHLTDGVSVGERSERGGIRRKRSAVRRLADEEELVSERSRLINRQAVTERGPFGCLLAAQFEDEFLPFGGLVGRRDGDTLEGMPESLSFQAIPGGRPLEELCQRQKECLPREGLANVAAELALQHHLFAGLA